MKMFGVWSLALALFCVSVNSDIRASEWKELIKGNVKFVNNKKFARERSKLKKQNPPTVVLGCIDSRSPPELVFDQGLGKMFVVRTGGNVVGDTDNDNVVIDSIEFCVGNFDVNTLIVLGHTRCGAVEGALNRLRKNGGIIDPIGPGHLNAVLVPIEMAIKAAGINIYAKDALEQSIRANISYVANQLVTFSPVIAKAVRKGKVTLIGAELNVLSGRVKKLFEYSKDLTPKKLPFDILSEGEDFSLEQEIANHSVQSSCACH